MKNSREVEGSVTTQLIEDNIIETVYDGYISVPMAKEVELALGKLLARHPNASWLIDASAATGVAAVPGESRTAMFKLFKGSGCRFALIVSSTPLRMMAATFAFAFGVPMKTFERRSEALEYLRSSR